MDVIFMGNTYMAVTGPYLNVLLLDHASVDAPYGAGLKGSLSDAGFLQRLREFDRDARASERDKTYHAGQNISRALAQS
jgi:hypothetical protein